MKSNDPLLTNCDTEPIHLIGSIQPHGCLVIVNERTLVISHASSNVDAVIGWPLDALFNQSLEIVLGSFQTRQLRELALALPAPELLKPWQVKIVRADNTEIAVTVLAHRDSGQIVLEIFVDEPHSPSIPDHIRLRQRMIEDLRQPKTIQQATEAAVKLVRLLANHDRVMCYRFHEDGHGEVVAEETDRSDRFLGLHYPASDVPAPARRHFELNRVRLIADTKAEAVPVVAAQGAAEDVDLTFAKLRAVPPVHLTYLDNMGVRATLSLPLMVNGNLWGLIACHHYVPKALNPPELHTCEIASQIIEVFIEALETSEAYRQIIDAQRLAYEITNENKSGVHAVDRLRAFAPKLAEYFKADFLVGMLDGEWVSFLNWSGDKLNLAPLQEHAVDGIFMTDRLADFMQVEDYPGLVGGAYISLSNDMQDYVFLGRQEFRHSVSWAGKPKKPTGVDESGNLILEPRASFDQWIEEISGRSVPFAVNDHDNLIIVQQALRTVLNTHREQVLRTAQEEVQALQAALHAQFLTNARSASMGELASAIAHELNQPLAAISNFVAASRRRLSDQLQHLDLVVELMDDAVSETHRAGEIVRRLRNLMERGESQRVEIDLSETVASATKLAFTVDTPESIELKMELADDIRPVFADSVQIEQVIFNLVRNAIEAMADTEKRVLTIETRAKTEHFSEIVVSDTGSGIRTDVLDTLFEPLRSTKAEGMGIGLSLCRTTVEALGGQIFGENTENGARFSFTLPFAQEENGNGK